MGMAKHDLITKDFALYVVHYFASMLTWSKQDILGEIDRAIKEAKPADAVPVVRCKDCKYRKRPLFAGNGIYCVENRRHFELDDFCSYGERRGGE